MKKITFLLLTISVLTNYSQAQDYQAFYPYSPSLYLHYAIFDSQQTETKGDIIYLHGYGDQLENHLPLFQRWNQEGLRVISFDFPSHGKTSGYSDLDDYSFLDLGKMVYALELQTREDPFRPLYLAGWSTGGLLALRMLQSNRFLKFGRSLSGLILFSPGVSVHKCVGSPTCFISNKTLTHNKVLHTRPIKPSSPLLYPHFALKLLYNAHQSWKTTLPYTIPTLIFLANEQDQYVKTNDLKKWITKQKARGANIKAIQCPNSHHELDNEIPSRGGVEVRNLSANFLSNLTKNQTHHKNLKPAICREI